MKQETYFHGGKLQTGWLKLNFDAATAVGLRTLWNLVGAKLNLDASFSKNDNVGMGCVVRDESRDETLGWLYLRQIVLFFLMFCIRGLNMVPIYTWLWRIAICNALYVSLEACKSVHVKGYMLILHIQTYFRGAFSKRKHEEKNRTTAFTFICM